MDSRWARDAFTGIALLFLGGVGAGIAATGDGLLALIGVILAALAGPFAIVYLIAAGVRLGTE